MIALEAHTLSELQGCGFIMPYVRSLLFVLSGTESRL